MYSVYKKHLVMELECLGSKFYKFGIMHHATISFESDEESGSSDYATITFHFDTFNANTPVGVLCIDNLMVDLRTKKIRSWCKSIYDFVELGTMKDFNTPEEAIDILVQVMEDIKEKE